MSLLIIPELACNPDILSSQSGLYQAVLDALANKLFVTIRRSTIDVAVSGLDGVRDRLCAVRLQVPGTEACWNGLSISPLSSFSCVELLRHAHLATVCHRWSMVQLFEASHFPVVPAMGHAAPRQEPQRAETTEPTSSLLRQCQKKSRGGTRHEMVKPLVHSSLPSISW